MRDAELLPDLAQVPRGCILVLHNAGATDHFQVRNLGEIGQDFVLHAFGEISIVRIAAQIIEGQHGDALVRNSGRRSCIPIPHHKRSDTCAEKKQDSCDCRPTNDCFALGNSGQLFRNVRVSDSVVVKINHANAGAMLYFAFT